MIAWPDLLVQAIARRKAVIVLGSGVSANSMNPKGDRPPTWGPFLEHVCERFGSKHRHVRRALKNQKYLEACAYLKGLAGPDWDGIVRNKFGDATFAHARIHEAIFNLDLRIVISMNFDRIYEKYAASAASGTVIVKHHYDPDVGVALTGQDRYILKPHGSVDSVSRIIFTLEDYASARSAHSTFYEILNALIHTHIFLFVGCGVGDPDLQLIFEDYKYKHGTIPHFMTLPGPMNVDEKGLIERTRGLKILTYSPKDNHKELTDSLIRLAELADEVRDEVARLQNW